jgi:nucleotide-binding universal stress UspA family protein
MPDRPIRRVLAPVDFAEGDDPDVNFAVRLSKQLGAELILFSVIDTPAMVRLIGTHKAFRAKTERAAADKKVGTLTATLVQDAKRILQRKVDEAAATGVVAHGHATVHEDVAEQILKEAIVQAVDLILIRAGRRHGFLHKLMGSTVEEVLDAAPCPVLVGEHD